ncbi:MFS transporter [Shewanella sp. NFH-SH190041]|uniref:MFS transporter n=1 Tax=Shewanella sp. NFH-SH190041 TaxID=2950245 RepID=UPI0021C2DAFD|nr:MFS transporter [Shewanella sp. NFH-SH190041]
MSTTSPTPNSTFVPVAGLSVFALASGYLMSLIPLSLPSFGLDVSLAPWLASVFYLGLLLGATGVEPVVARIGHRFSFVLFLAALLLTITLMIALPSANVWLVARLLAGIAVAGVFVVVESWLLMADTPKQRAKRLGLYMTSLYGGTALGQLGIGQFGTQGLLPYALICLLLLIAILPPLLIRKGQPCRQGHQKIAWRELRGLSRPAIMGCLVSGLTLGPIYGMLPVYIKAQTGSESQTGLMMAMVILGGMVVQPLVSYLSPRMSKSLLMAFFCLIGAASVFMLVISQDALMLTLAYSLLGASTFALYPIAITLACDSMSANKIVAATQFMLLSYSIGSVVGPLLASSFNSMQYSLLMYLGPCLFSTCIYMLIKSFRAPRDQQPLATQ